MLPYSRISIIVAHSENMAIGRGNTLIWHLPGDLKRFKDLTLGHPVVMGRKTWESLPEKFRPLPGRTNIVITRDTSYPARGATVVDSLEKALRIAKESEGAEEIFVIGGGEIYRQALPHTDRLYVTKVYESVVGDIFFPEYAEFRKVISQEDHLENDPPYSYITLEK